MSKSNIIIETEDNEIIKSLISIQEKNKSLLDNWLKKFNEKESLKFIDNLSKNLDVNEDSNDVDLLSQLPSFNLDFDEDSNNEYLLSQLLSFDLDVEEDSNDIDLLNQLSHNNLNPDDLLKKITPPLKVDIWLSQSDDSLNKAIHNILNENSNVNLVPYHCPLGLIRGEDRKIFEWNIESESAIEIKMTLNQAFLENKKNINIISSTNSFLSEDLMILCFPIIKVLDLNDIEKWLKNFKVRRIVWFENVSDKIAKKDIQHFLKQLAKNYSIHISLIDILSSQKTALKTDANPALISTNKQLENFYSPDFLPWIHVSQ